MSARKCVVCGKPLAAVIKEAAHPACIFLDDTESYDPLALKLKKEIIEVVKWADWSSARSQQKTIGPSEIGDPCDRRIGYRIAEVPEVNDRFDPWAAIVGTSIHSWLDQAFTARNLASPPNERIWLTETRLPIAGQIRGRSDLFNLVENCVIDHKGAGPSVMRKVAKDGPGPGYVVQIQLYGYGYKQLGYDVKKVALAFYPRAGWLRDLYVWTDDYKEDVALAALERISVIAQKVMNLDMLNKSYEHRWEQIEARPSDSCGFCPWYVPDRDLEVGANLSGCPGR